MFLFMHDPHHLRIASDWAASAPMRGMKQVSAYLCTIYS